MVVTSEEEAAEALHNVCSAAVDIVAADGTIFVPMYKDVMYTT